MITRLEGKASLVAFALFASTATAAAESVWVLWLTPITDNPRWESSLRLQFHTLEDCDRHAALMLSEFSLMYPNAVLEARCHSLTPDPREAMSKTRREIGSRLPSHNTNSINQELPEM